MFRTNAMYLPQNVLGMFLKESISCLLLMVMKISDDDDGEDDAFTVLSGFSWLNFCEQGSQHLFIT